MAKKKAPPERWLVILEPMPDDVPVVNRVRKLLKYAVRVCKLKVVGYPNDIPPGVTMAVLAEGENGEN